MCNPFLSGILLLSIIIIGVCVLAGCLQGKKEMIFQQKLFVKVLFHCQNDQYGQVPASQF